ncbi:hypothetical protein Cci01nite_18140 [Catellatospora citrea]|uniref:Uncharacterized protein n=1 Tax=Catellatospora citrea TaxID=53366 RepID=A0A8J3KGI2_9ACTN|nr:hypothetical protein Cci01nite_18140 [Catellatospora citrea]
MSESSLSNSTHRDGRAKRLPACFRSLFVVCLPANSDVGCGPPDSDELRKPKASPLAWWEPQRRVPDDTGHAFGQRVVAARTRRPARSAGCDRSPLSGPVRWPDSVTGDDQVNGPGRPESVGIDPNCDR